MIVLSKWFSDKFSKGGSHAGVTIPITSAPAPLPVDPDPDAKVILRDVFTSPRERTVVEVRTDGIHTRPVGSEETAYIAMQGGAADDARYSQLDDNLRCQMARKIAVLVPDLAETQRNELLRYAMDVLHYMAKDQLTRVRQVIAEELCETPNAPRGVIAALMWDEEADVKVPILEFSPLLSDLELLDIIGTSSVPAVLEAIARRKQVSEKVGDAIIKADQPGAIGQLLENPGAKLSADALDQIIERAPQYTLWHEPLLKRPELTQKTIDRIAGFVSTSLIGALREENKISRQVADSLMNAILARLRNLQGTKDKSAESRAQRFYRRGELTQDVVMRYLDFNEPEFVSAALALLSGVPLPAVQQMVRSQHPKAVVSLCWKAGLSMRNAIQVELRLARIHHSRVLYAKEGIHYPLSDNEMRHYLDLFLHYNG